jgi:hypothetical protein
VERESRKLKQFLIAAGSALFFAGLNCQANALGTVSGGMSATLQYRLAGQVTGCTYSTGTTNGCDYFNTTGFLPYNSSNGDPWSGLSASLTANATSAVDTAGLHAEVDLTVTNEPLDTNLQHYWGSNPGSGTATANWSDTLTISGGAPAFLVLGYTLDGTLSASGHSRADLFTSVSLHDSAAGGGNAGGTNLYSTISAIGPQLPTSQTLFYSLAVSPGDTVSLGAQLQARVFYGCQAFSPILCAGATVADVSHTLKFSQLGFQDGQGNWLSGYSVGSADGFDYNALNPANATATPEPGSFAYGMLLLAPAWYWRRRVRQG